MTVKITPCQPSPRNKSSIPFSSTFTFTCISPLFRRLSQKIKKSNKKFPLVSFSRFDFELPVPWTLNLESCFDFKLYIHFDPKLLVLWTLNLKSRFDY